MQGAPIITHHHGRCITPRTSFLPHLRLPKSGSICTYMCATCPCPPCSRLGAYGGSLCHGHVIDGCPCGSKRLMATEASTAYSLHMAPASSQLGAMAQCVFYSSDRYKSSASLAKALEKESPLQAAAAPGRWLSSRLRHVPQVSPPLCHPSVSHSTPAPRRLSLGSTSCVVAAQLFGTTSLIIPS